MPRESDQTIFIRFLILASPITAFFGDDNLNLTFENLSALFALNGLIDLGSLVLLHR